MSKISGSTWRSSQRLGNLNSKKTYRVSKKRFIAAAYVNRVYKRIHLAYADEPKNDLSDLMLKILNLLEDLEQILKSEESDQPRLIK